MKRFINQYNELFTGMISCFDRILFKGYLPLWGDGMEAFLANQGLRIKDFSKFVQQQSGRIGRGMPQRMAESAGRPMTCTSIGPSPQGSDRSGDDRSGRLAARARLRDAGRGTVPEFQNGAGRGTPTADRGQTQVPLLLLLFSRSETGAGTCAYPVVVPAGRSGLPQRTRCPGPQTRQTRHRLSQARQRFYLDRRYTAGPTLRRPAGEDELAAHSHVVCSARESFAEGSLGGHGLLLGHRSRRVCHRRDVQKSRRFEAPV